MIYVMKDSRIIEVGDHETLLNLRGVYSDLWEKEKIIS